MSYFSDYQASSFYDNMDRYYAGGYSNHDSPKSTRGTILFSTDKAVLFSIKDTQYIAPDVEAAFKAIGKSFKLTKLELRAWFAKSTVTKITNVSIHYKSWANPKGIAYYSGEKVSSILGNKGDRNGILTT